MANVSTSRSSRFAVEFEAAQDEFIKLIESLTDEQWHLRGKNHPQRMNDEDEGRTIGVIAHHVAETGPWIIDRIQAMVDGRPLSPVDFRIINARHAVEHADATRDDVVQLLRTGKRRIAAAVRAIPDGQLEQPHDTPAGPATVAQRLEWVLIGHVRAHQGSIKAAIS